MESLTIEKYISEVKNWNGGYIVCGEKSFIKDFLYVFDHLKIIDIVEYDNYDEALKKLRKCYSKEYCIIFCDKRHELTKQISIFFNLEEKKHYILAEKFFQTLDFNLAEKIAGKKVAFWGIGTELNYFRLRNKLVCDFYIDGDIKKDGLIKDELEIIHPSKIKDWNNIFIVITTFFFYPEIKKELECFGLKEKENFIFYRDLLLKPSKMMYEVIYSPKKFIKHCNRPFFEFAEFAYGGALYCCCPGWVKNPMGYVISKTPDEVWNSVVAKIFRLSILNKSYCFCKEKECPFMIELKGEERDKQIIKNYELVKTHKFPENIIVSIDQSCNLKCKSCRSEWQTKPGKDKGIIQMIAENIRKSNWLNEVKHISFAGMGDVFVSDIYKNLMYDHGETKRKSISIISNGILFNEENWNKIMLHYECVDNVNISVDAATKKTYEYLRGGNWEVLHKNLDFISKKRMDGQIKFLSFSYVVQLDNCDEMVPFVELGKKYNVDKVIFRKIFDTGSWGDKFNDISIIDERGKLKSHVRRVLDNEIFNDPIVNLHTLKQLL